MDNQNMIYLESFQDYYFSDNIPIGVIQSNENIDVQIILNTPENGEVINITESHTPDWNYFGWQGVVYIDIADLISGHLISRYPLIPDNYFDITERYHQGSGFGTVVIKVNENVLKSFKVIKGSVTINTSISHFSFENYLQKNILSSCPQIRNVHPGSQNVFNVFAIGPTKIYSKAKIFTGYDLNGSPEYSYEEKQILALDGLEGSQLTTFTVKLDYIITYFYNNLWVLNRGKNIVHIDIYSRNDTTGIQTAPIRLIPDHSTYIHDDLFAFENSLGGIDIIRFTGVLSESIEHEYLSQVNLGRTFNYGLIPGTVYKKNTGYFANQEYAIFANDFLSSTNIYHYKNGRFEPIYITEKEAIYKQGEIGSFSFSFKYSKQHTGKMLNRNTEL